ncbi:DUF551 domain-containing protein [Actinobacillus porcinus]|uniref:DUF551 domain-containing protein n=1 Tax=Actinobacillus porcinus TaxID=51048 RepID=UPI002353E72F|nr:DUF551 domain-containing protein [Actinobacillus porcinus]
MHKSINPLVENYSLIGVQEYSKGNQQQVPISWYLDGRWNSLDDEYCREFDIVGMFSPANTVDNSWISVDDRLPDDGQEVLIVWNGETRIAIADLVTGNGALFSFRFEALDEEEWSAIYRYSGEIKFWRPLPKSPEELRNE